MKLQISSTPALATVYSQLRTCTICVSIIYDLYIYIIYINDQWISIWIHDTRYTIHARVSRYRYS